MSKGNKIKINNQPWHECNNQIIHKRGWEEDDDDDNVGKDNANNDNRGQ